MNSVSVLHEQFDRSVGMALARQCALADTIPDKFWTWSFTTDDDGEGLVNLPGLGLFPAQFLGSESFVSNTWLAAWANEHVHDGHAKLSCWLRGYSKDMSEERIGGEYYSLEDMNGDYIGVIACGVSPTGAYVVLPTLDSENNHVGDQYVLIEELPLVNYNPVPLQRIMTVCQMIMDSEQVTDSELAIKQFLGQLGFILDETSAGEKNSVEGFTDEKGRTIELSRREYKTVKGKDRAEFAISCALSDSVVSPDSFDVEAQWQQFVRAPLSRCIEKIPVSVGEES